MEELDPKLKAQMDKFGITLDMLTSVMKANSSASKSINTEALNQLRVQKQLVETLKQDLSLSEKEAVQFTKRLKREEENATKDQARKQKSIKDDQAVDSIRANAVKRAAEDLLGFARNSMNASQSIYNSNQAFSAAIPTLELVGTAFKGLADAAAGVMAGIPVLGGLATGASKVLNTATSIAVQVATMQLQNAQKFVDTYSQLSKSGAAFGGNIEDMRKAAAAGGMSIETYSKFVTSNVSSLNRLGGSLEESSERVAKLGKNIAAGNPKILAMYGTFDALAGSTADFMAMQAGYGIDTTKNIADLEAGAREYLVAQKELSTLTGKSAEGLKKSEEERQKSAAYQIAISKMSLQEQANTRKAIEIIELQYGKKAAETAQEMVARNGEIISKSALTFQAFNPVLTQTVQDILGTSKKSREDFNAESAALVTGRQERIKAEQMTREDLLKLQAGGAKDSAGVLSGLNETAAAVFRTQESQGKMVQTATDLEEARNKKVSDSTVAFSSVITSLEKYKIGIDEQTDKYLGKTGEMVNALLGVQTKLNDVFGNKLMGLVNDHVIPGLDKLATTLNNLPTADDIKNKGGDGLFGVNTTGPKAQEYKKKGGIYGALGGAAAALPMGVAMGAPLGPIGMAVGGITSMVGGAYAGYKGLGAVGETVGGAMDMMSGGAGVPSAGKPGATGKLSDIIDFGGNSGGEANFGKLDNRVREQFTQMAAEYSQLNPGKKLSLNSAFRSHEEQQKVYDDYISGKSKHKAAPPGKSLHQIGKAIDINSSQVDELKTAGLLAKYGFKQPYPNNDQPHIELMAKGGITNGPSIAGEAGPEAVVPLPDGRQIPVKIDWSEMRDTFTEMIKVLKDHKDTSDKMLRASQ